MYKLRYFAQINKNILEEVFNLNKIIDQISAFLIALFELEYEHLLNDEWCYDEHGDPTAKL